MNHAQARYDALSTAQDAEDDRMGVQGAVGLGAAAGSMFAGGQQ